MSELEGRGADWTEEPSKPEGRLKGAPEAGGRQGTSDEGPPPQAARPARRRLKAPRRRAGETE